MDDLKDFTEPVVLLGLPFRIVPEVVDAVARSTHALVLQLTREASNAENMSPAPDTAGAKSTHFPSASKPR
jgi:hypothetical protein